MPDILSSLERRDEIDKAEYKIRAEKIRIRLLELQKQLAASHKAALILINGVEGSGKGETTKKLLEWLDARGVETTAFWIPGAEASEHPALWRFWNKLPARGRTGIFFGSWYTEPIIGRVFRTISKDEFAASLDDIVKLEKMLSAEGIILIKLWMYLSPADQKEMLRHAKKKAKTRWRITRLTRRFTRKRRRFHKIDVATLNATHSEHAPWFLIDARHEQRREISTGELITQRLASALSSDTNSEYTGIWKPARFNYLGNLDLTRQVGDDVYDVELKEHTARIALLSDRLSATQKSLLLVFEGPDAAGKGGAIRRVIYGIDPRHYHVNAVSAPTDVEKAHPYLWRFWQKAPPAGRICIFDRSWYGRVLVERIEKFCTEAEWQRAFGEINDFEKALFRSDTIIRKFYLSISSEEQLRRFRDRSTTPYKQYKLTEEDWRNRDKWDAYRSAANDMVENTSTAYAPWILVEANDKNHARIQVMKAVVAALEEAVG